MRVGLCTATILTCLIFSFFGCTPLPASPPSPFAQSLLMADDQKAKIVLFRSVYESFWFKSDFVHIHIDNNPFVRLAAGEFLPVYLYAGEHTIEASYSHHATLDFDHPAKATLKLKSGDVSYVLFAPKWEGIGFTPYFFLPIPVPATTAEIYMIDDESARNLLGTLLEGELLENRFLHEK